MRILLALFLLTTTSVWADVSGKWTGWVYWTFQGSGPKCLSDISFEESETTLHRVGGFVDCDIVTMEINEQILTKMNGKLLLNNEVVGSYTTDTYQWTERYSGDVIIENTINSKGTSFDYQEKWIQSDGRDLYNIEGRFFKK